MAGSVVIDANIAIYAVFPGFEHKAAISLLERLVENECPICVPHLWLAEVTTSLRKTALSVSLSKNSVLLALSAAFSLPIQLFSEDADLCHRVYCWADEL